MDEQAGLLAERSLLGALLIRGRLDAVPPELKPEDFGSVQNQAIYKTMLKLEAEESLVDTMTVYHALPGDLSVKTYLASLLDGIPNPDEEGIRAYAKIVMEDSTRRRLGLKVA